MTIERRDNINNHSPVVSLGEWKEIKLHELEEKVMSNYYSTLSFNELVNESHITTREIGNLGEGVSCDNELKLRATLLLKELKERIKRNNPALANGPSNFASFEALL